MKGVERNPHARGERRACRAGTPATWHAVACRPAHLWARRILQASQAQEGEVALDAGILGGVGQALVAAVRLAAVVVGQVSRQVGALGAGEQAQRAVRQTVQQPGGGGMSGAVGVVRQTACLMSSRPVSRSR